MIHGVVDRGRLAVHRLGFDVRRDQFRHRFVPALEQHGITDVVDVGANVGQFAIEMRRAGFTGRLLSIEPLADAYDDLRRRAASDPEWTTRRAVVSDHVGRATIHRSANSVSSSVLPILEAHTRAAPSSRYVASEEVDAITLDALLEELGIDPATTLCKIDVQGFEGQVLDGASRSLPVLGAVRTELSLVELYEGQHLMPELVARLASDGLQLWMIEPGFVDPDNHRLLQLDGVFLRDR